MRKWASMPVIQYLSSPLGLIIFSISVFAGYLVIVPQRVLEHGHIVIATIFVLSFALLSTCTFTQIKERFKSAKQSTNSTGGFIGMAIGITALQACGLGIPSCGMGALTGLIALFVPGTLFNIISAYSNYVISLSIIIQIVALYRMGCFKTNTKPI